MPPLNGLRAFEAAARHLSFTRAADELAVTQAAVSQQVRRLEDWLQVKLFLRLDSGLELTPAGRSYLPALRSAFDAVAEATARILPPSASCVLTVATTPNFATRWLAPRLWRFAELQPDVDVDLNSSLALVDFAQEEVDCGIRFGRGNWPGLVAETLFAEKIYAVCSPRLAEQPPGLHRVEDLRHYTLLHDDFLVQWKQWLLAAGVGDVSWVRGPRFNDSALMVQMAIEGRGVALAMDAMVADDLRAGRLVRPFEITLASDFAYYFVAPPAALERPAVRAFHDWIVAEAAVEAARL